MLEAALRNYIAHYAGISTCTKTFSQIINQSSLNPAFQTQQCCLVQDSKATYYKGE